MKKLLITFFTLVLFSKVMGNDISWAFPPVTISSASVSASDPQIATDSSGNLVAVWVENGFVKASDKPVSGSWSAAATISSSSASVPRIVSDLSGNATAVWLEGGTVKAASKPFGGSWSAATSLSSGTTSTSPDVGVNAAGDVVAVWAKNGNVESSTKMFGAAWQTRAILNSTSAASPHVALGGTGSNSTAVVVWTGTSGGQNVVRASSKIITGSWSTQVTISDTAHNAGYADVAVDGNANTVAVWYAYDVEGSNYSNVNVQSSYLLSGGSWEPATQISESGIRNPATLVARVAFDAIGNAVAVWNTSFDDISYNIQSALRPIRGIWAAPTEVVSSNLFASDVDLAVSSLGDALAVYMFYNGAFMLIQSSESDFTGFLGTQWSVPVNLSSGANHGFPRVAATLSGNTIYAGAVWISTNGSVNTILATTGTRSVVLPPTSLSVVQNSNNFGGVFTEYYNTVSWTASASPEIVSYVIYRNGAQIAQVDGTVTSFRDDNRVQSGAVTYGVAAVDNQSSQSTIPTVNYP